MAAAGEPGWKELSGGQAQPRPWQAAEPEPQRRSGAAAARPPASQPASACGEPARLPAGARESHCHRPAQAQAQALRRGKRSGVYRALEAGAAGAGPGSSADLPFSPAGAGAPASRIGLGARPWQARPARAPGTLPCEAGPGWGPGHGRGTAPTAGPWAGAR